MSTHIVERLIFFSSPDKYINKPFGIPMDHSTLSFVKIKIYTQDSIVGRASPDKILLNIINHELTRQRRG